MVRVNLKVEGKGLNVVKRERASICWVMFVCATALSCVVDTAYAASSIGAMAASITDTFAAIGKLITAGSYIAGLGFSVGAIMKFKQHKDSPTQVQVGQPISMVLIAAALLFLPTLLDTVGNTMFGSGGAKTAGPTGTSIS